MSTEQPGGLFLSTRAERRLLRYNPTDIESRWQKIWAETDLYKTGDDTAKPKHYELEFFPYPSGVTMHVGHVRNYVISDAFARYKRMTGHNVLHPMGWDAFGLPAENQAIKTGVPPRQSTDDNIAVFKRQLSQVGLSFDWSREIDSSRPDYYRWTQWLFLQFFKAGLAYKAEAPVNWCPKDKTVLANEQVIKVDGQNVCERCETPVEKRQLSQWFLKITDYADRLLEDLEDLDWPEGIKAMQRNWIGRSTGAEIEFAIPNSKSKIPVFTTRADTIFSAAFIVLAPEHPLVKEVTAKEQQAAVNEYVSQAITKSDVERQEEEKDKTGIFSGGYAINPANNERIPIWIADFVLGSYGTGAVFGDIHDERDFEFVKKFKIPARVTVIPEDPKLTERVKQQEVCFHDEGILIDSGEFSGLRSQEARDKIIAWLAKQGKAKEQVNYKMRDWLISRQRYWGAPIPIIHCPDHGAVPVPDGQLPVVLPELGTYQPSDDARSPLARVPEFVNTKCPKCGKSAQRETDTMDTFVDSSWYFLRFTDPHNDQKPFDKAKANYWMSVDTYVGGAEHAVAHLLFSRFWMKVLFDQGLVAYQEPFKRLRNHGMIGGADGRKMGKRYGNVVTPDDIIGQGYGADALRLFELFIAPFDQASDWNTRGVPGTFRFLQRFWNLVQEYLDSDKDSKADPKRLLQLLHQTIQKVSGDLQAFAFNTAVASMMEAVNELYKIKLAHGIGKDDTWKEVLTTMTQLLAPFAPHIAEELWHQLQSREQRAESRGIHSVHLSEWPVHDEEYLVSEAVTIVVQVNGRVRANIEVPADSSEEDVIKTAKADPKIAEWLKNKTARKTVYVPQKLINFVV